MSTESYTFPRSIEHPAQTIARDQAMTPALCRNCRHPQFVHGGGVRACGVTRCTCYEFRR